MSKFASHYISEGCKVVYCKYYIIALNEACFPITSAVEFLTKEGINVYDGIKQILSSNPSCSSDQKLLSKKLVDYYEEINTHKQANS